MKNYISILVCFFISFGALYAQDQDVPKTKVYCLVMCETYNMVKADLNVIVDFGIADKATNANGWIYNTDTNKRMSFASPMSVINYMAKRGWEYKDVTLTDNDAATNQNVRQFILVKEVPIDCSVEDIIGDIDYRKL